VSGPGNYNLNTVCKRFKCTVEDAGAVAGADAADEIQYRVFGLDKRKVASAASRIRELGRASAVGAAVAADAESGRRLWALGRHGDADVAALVGNFLSSCP